MNRSPEPNPAETSERFSAEDKPSGIADKIVWAIVRGVLATWVLYGIMAVGGWIALTRLPDGKAFVLQPRSWGLVADLTWWILVISFCSVVYSLPAMVVRSHIGCLVRVCTVLIFLVVVTKFQIENCIAVVQQQNHFVFVRRFPLPNRRLPANQVGSVRVYRARLSQAIELRVGPLDYVRSTSVWRNDEATTKILQELIEQLRSVDRRL